MSKKLLFIAITCLSVIMPLACSGPDEFKALNNELDRLDKTLQDAPKYDARKKRCLDSLRLCLSSTPVVDTLRLWKLNMELGNQYHSFCSDSSAMYYHRACQLTSSGSMTSQNIDSRIAMADAQGAAGLFTLAYSSLSELDTTALTKDQHIKYAMAARQLHSYMREYAKGHLDIEAQFSRKDEVFEQYLINTLPSESPYRRFLSAQQMHRNGDNTNAHKVATTLINKLPENSNLYGMTAYLMAQISRSLGNEFEYGKYLILAATSDIKAGVKETMALNALAKWLYNRGAVDRAYTYVNASLQDAVTANARMRTVEIASLLPLIDEAYRKQMASSRNELMVYLILVVILFIVTGVLLVCVFRNMKRASLSNKRLAQQSKRQESYIGHFLGLCSSYSDKLESMRRLVDRKITAGQTDELLKMLKSGKYTDSEKDDFFSIFDETFLDLYPDFLEELNALLKPDCRLCHKRGEPLSTEIRIYAFVRLGVEESVKIARILHCSVSTIYTYRNRMRGRALDRNTFETEVMNIGNTSPKR